MSIKKISEGLTELVNSYEGMVKELGIKDDVASDKVGATDYDGMRKVVRESGGDVGSKIADAARMLVDSGNTDGRFCWDFCFLAYYIAEAVPNAAYQDLNYSGHICGNHHAGPDKLGSIGTGSWLYINNQNTSDTHGNHSVVVLGINGNGATVASLWQPHQVPKIHNIDFRSPKGYVTYIGKPVAVKSDNSFFNYMKTRK